MKKIILLALTLILAYSIITSVLASDTSFESPRITGNASNDWTNGNNVFYSDNLYTTSVFLNDKLDTSDYNIFIPPTASVRGINVTLEGSCTGAGCGTIDVNFELSGDSGRTYTSNGYKAILTATETVFSQGGPSDLWGVALGGWTPDNFSRDNFRVRLDVTSIGALKTANVDNVGVGVEYEFPGFDPNTPDNTTSFGAVNTSSAGYGSIYNTYVFGFNDSGGKTSGDALFYFPFNLNETNTRFTTDFSAYNRTAWWVNKSKNGILNVTTIKSNWTTLNGIYGGYYRLDGSWGVSNESFKIQASPELDLSAQNWTIEFWVKRDNQSVQAQDASWFAQENLVLFPNSSLRIFFERGYPDFSPGTPLLCTTFDCSPALPAQCEMSSSYVPDVWNHVAVTRGTDTNYTMWVNGVKTSVNSRQCNSGNNNYSDFIYFGDDALPHTDGYGTVHYGLNGSLDEVIFYNRTLTNAEVQQHNLTNYNYIYPPYAQAQANASVTIWSANGSSSYGSASAASSTPVINGKFNATIVYASTNRSGSSFPKYRIWDNSTGTWTQEYEMADPAAVILPTNITTVKVISSKKKPYVLALVETTGRNFSLYVSKDSGQTWNILKRNLGSKSATSTSATQFVQADMAELANTSRILIVYDISASNANQDFGYRFFEDGILSPEMTYNITAAGNIDPIKRLGLASSPNASKDEAVFVGYDELGANQAPTYAAVFNGTSWGNDILISTSGSVDVVENAAIAYESQSYDALVYAANGTDLSRWCEWKSQGFWLGCWSADPDGTAGNDGKLAFLYSDPNSNNITVMQMDDLPNFLTAAIWNGTNMSSWTSLDGNADSNTKRIFTFSYNSSGNAGQFIYEGSNSPSGTSLSQRSLTNGALIGGSAAISTYRGTGALVEIQRNPDNSSTTVYLGIRMNSSNYLTSFKMDNTNPAPNGWISNDLVPLAVNATNPNAKTYDFTFLRYVGGVAPTHSTPLFSPSPPVSTNNLTVLNQSTSDPFSMLIWNIYDWKYNMTGGKAVSTMQLNMPFDTLCTVAEKNRTGGNIKCVTDYSDTKYHGALGNGTAFYAPTWINITGLSPLGAKAYYGGAYYFNGSYRNWQGISLPQIENLTLGNMTVCLKFNLTNDPNGLKKACDTEAGGQDKGCDLFATNTVHLSVENNASIHFYFSNLSGLNNLATTGYAYNDSVWHSVCGTAITCGNNNCPSVDYRNNASLYVDGKLMTTIYVGRSNAVVGSTCAPWGGATIGSICLLPGNRNDTFSGVIDEVRWYNRSISYQEILDYNQTYYNVTRNETLITGMNTTACITPTDGEFEGVTKCTADIVVAASAATISFTVFTLSPTLFGNFTTSKTTLPGNETDRYIFNTTMAYAEFIPACMFGSGVGQSSGGKWQVTGVCQNGTDISPLFVFRNTGNVPINITLNFSADLSGSGIRLCANSSVPAGSSATAVSPCVFSGKGTLNNSVNLIVLAQLATSAPNNEGNVSIWANFTNVGIGSSNSGYANSNSTS